MTEEDKYALWEFFTGVEGVIGTSAIIISIIIVVVYFSSGGEPMSSSFEVVDKYKECDIIRYAPHQAAEYKYFLYCEGNK